MSNKTEISREWLLIDKRESLVQRRRKKKSVRAFQAALFTVVVMSKSIEITFDGFDIHSDGLKDEMYRPILNTF